jgi:ribosomal protein L37AE/L43A
MTGDMTTIGTAAEEEREEEQKLCQTCGNLIELERIKKDSLVMHCKVCNDKLSRFANKIIPNAMQIHVKDEIVHYYTWSDCKKM